MAASKGDLKMTVPEGMNYFGKRQVNTGEQWEYSVPVEPRTLDFDPNRELEFFVSGATPDHINLAKSTFNIRFRVRKQNKDHNFVVNPDNPEADEVEYAVPIDGFFHTMWKKIVLKLNNEIVSESREHAYRAYIELMTTLDDSKLPEAKDNLLYTRNSGDDVDASANPYISKNKGAQERWKVVKDKEWVTLSGPLLLDFWNQGTLIPGGVDLHIFMTPNFDKFRFQATHKDAMKEDLFLDIEHCYLELVYKTMTPAALRGLETSWNNHPMTMPFTRTEVNILQLRPGIREIRIPDLYSRQTPSRLVLAMVKQEAYVGDFSLDPFNFVHNDIETASFGIDNILIPSRPYEFDIERDAKGSVQRALDELRRFCGHKEVGIDKSNYTKGKFLLVFNTDPTVNRDLGYWGMKRSGNTKLHLTFRNPIHDEHNLILIATFPAEVKIDKNAVVSVV